MLCLVLFSPLLFVYLWFLCISGFEEFFPFGHIQIFFVIIIIIIIYELYNIYNAKTKSLDTPSHSNIFFIFMTVKIVDSH